ncbi:MAG: thiosulfate dehydrogenase (quinone) large subunit [Frankiaceae bacterium]|jgi:thiosulfate dehydrogenase [quinone] large subunit|nr:thiosulfate dehydrogenase (quinone) large subunit [Frankiaceae bacterium]
MSDVTRDAPNQPWWALLPLRLFLGVTFSYAGMQKFFDPAYLNGRSPLSVQSTIRALEHQSPIGFVLSWSAHAPVLVGVLIAGGELAVGLATLLGLWVRLTAAGGFVLALTFFLTVSWHTRPYYYGSDIAFMAAWTVPLLIGSWGGPSLDAVIRRRAAVDPEPGRRRLLLGAAAAGALGALTGGLAAAVAATGRSLSRSAARTDARGTPVPVPIGHGSEPQPGTSAKPSSTPAGRLLAHTTDVPRGSAVTFTDDTGGPAVLIHEPDGRFRAFSTVCTHAGCTVLYAGRSGLVCPCHGGQFDAATGEPIAGPPPSPLSSLRVSVAGGQVRLVR